jgi:putative addiction module component (TIGR02574 family)
MPISLEEIERQVESLTVEERSRLVQFLLESLHPIDPDIAAAWDREIEERVAAFDRGEMQSHPADDVFAEARHQAL